MVDLTFALGVMILRGIIDLTVALGGMKLGDGRFDCCTERYESLDGRFDCCTERYETRGW